MKQGKVVICNIIMALISVAAIVTLIVGSFMKITVTLNIDGEKMAEIMDSQQGSGTGETQGVISSDEYYGNEDGFTDGETGGSYDDGDSANGGESSSSGMEELFKDINLSLPISLDFKSIDLIGSVIGDASEKMNAMLEREIGGIVDVLMNSIDKVLSGVVGVVVNQVVDKAEAEVRKQLEEAGQGNISEEEIKETLESEYGITESDIETLKTELSTAVSAVLNGETDDSGKFLRESETLDKLVHIYAEEELKQETGRTEFTQAEIEAKAAELKNSVAEEYDSALESMEIDGELNKETVVINLLNNAEMQDENGNVIVFENMDQVKSYLASKAQSLLGEEVGDYMGLAMKIMGIFTLVVIAAWGYFLIKIIVKTLFSRTNKTVGMFFPRFFGWMPHVFFVGLPMAVFNNLDKIAELAKGQEMFAGVADMLTQYSSLATINITSLTWVSALGSVLLLIILIPYYQWRRKLKREAKLNKRRG